MAALTFTLADIKNGFFSEQPDYEMLVKASSYSFLSQNHIAIQKENDILKAALDVLNKDKAYTEYRELSLYYDKLLALYHNKRNEAKNRKDNWTTYLHDNLGTLHLYRIMLTFARLTDDQLIRVLSQAQWFNDLNQAMAGIFNFDQTISVLNLPVSTLNVLSVLFLGLRFLVVSAEILKHTFAPTDKEKEDLSAWERFCHETGTYGFSLANDFVWATLNALSNFPDFFNIPIPIANALVLVCLIFDLSLIAYQYHLETAQYAAEKATYLAEGEKIDAMAHELMLVQEQLKVLESKHIKTTSELQLALIAAAILIVGFAVLLAFASPVVAPIGCFLCLFGTAIYTSLGAYGDYQQQTHLLKALKQEGKSEAEIKRAEAAQQAAWDSGLKSLVKHTVLPMILIGVFAVCWPAGLLLAAAYLAYEMSAGAEEDTAQLQEGLA